MVAARTQPALTNRAMRRLWVTAVCMGIALVACVDSVEIRPDRIRLAEDLPPIMDVRALRFTPDVSMVVGMFSFARQNVDDVALVLRDDGNGRVAGVDPGGRTWLVLHYAESGSGGWTIQVENVSGEDLQGIGFSLPCQADDIFWGGGEQYNFVDLRGQSVDIWTQEQGVGRSENGTPPFGDLTDTYYPVPWLAQPRQGWGLLIDSPAYSRLDVCDTQPGEVAIDVWDPNPTLRLFGEADGDAETGPLRLTEVLTRYTGRTPQLPPDWAWQGVWLGAQGGTTAVTERLQTALDAQIPVSAVWVQDWVGARNFGGDNFGVKYRWVHDQGWYPGLKETIADFAAQGVRFLGYFNPFVVPDYDDHYPEAVSNGYLVETADGDPYLFTIITFDGGLLDVFNDEAASWFQRYARAAAELGMRGWMADFGEWVPFDAHVAAGEGARWHNLYPERWHQLNRQVLEAAWPDGDFVLLTRSGFTHEARVAQIVWAGDQEASWDPGDGIPTVVTAGLTAGFSGIPLFTHDIAGFSGGPSDRELFQRWVELGAFSPFMRTHDGLRKHENHRFDSDEATLVHFRTMARLHQVMSTYFRELADESLASGLPLIRHTAMVDPEWPEAWQADHQWMLGDDVVFVPVVAPGVDRVDAWLPKGDWIEVFGSGQESGRQVVPTPAPIGKPALWVRAGVHAHLVEQLRAIVEAESAP
ncbi:MAG: hypothetical protein D6761_05100 [Candidatus Dadabacteria bacterium]|nr:MAG: hypothetical protein D6761_05100 [Candidatus Dadabacteria bacterium]